MQATRNSFVRFYMEGPNINVDLCISLEYIMDDKLYKMGSIGRFW